MAKTVNQNSFFQLKSSLGVAESDKNSLQENLDKTSYILNEVKTEKDSLKKVRLAKNIYNFCI